MSDPETYEVYAIQYCHRSNRSKGETFLSPVLSADFHDVAQDITYTGAVDSFRHRHRELPLL